MGIFLSAISFPHNLFIWYCMKFQHLCNIFYAPSLLPPPPTPHPPNNHGFCLHVSQWVKSLLGCVFPKVSGQTSRTTHQKMQLCIPENLKNTAENIENSLLVFTASFM